MFGTAQGYSIEDGDIESQMIKAGTTSYIYSLDQKIVQKIKELKQYI